MDKQRIVVDFIPGTSIVTIAVYEKSSGKELCFLHLDVTEAFELSKILELAVRRVYAELK